MAADRGYIENLKELRSIRIQQIKQMNADQRYHNLQSEYNRRLLRYNELFVSNMKDMTSKLGSAIANLSSKLASGVGSAASGVAGGVSSLSGSILSGLGKALPIGIAALIAKVLVWDNMSSDTQDKLSNAFGNLMEKLMEPVRGMIGKVTEGFKSLDIKFPLFDELFKRFTKFFEILQSGFRIVSMKFESMMETVNKDPKKYVKDTLHLLGDTALFALLSIVAGKVVLQMFRNHMLLNSIDNLLAKRMGQMPVGPGGQQLAPVAPGGGGRTGRGGRPLSSFEQKYPKLVGAQQNQIKAAEQTTKAILKRGGARLIGGLMSGPVITMATLGLLAYDVYVLLTDWGVKDEDAIAAVNGVYPEGILDLQPMSGEPITGTIKMKELSAETKKRAENLRKMASDIQKGKGVPPGFSVKPGESVSETATRLGEYYSTSESPELAAMYDPSSIALTDAYEANRKKVLDQLKLEEGKDVPAFVMERFTATWTGMKKHQRRNAVELRYPIVVTTNFVYYMGRDGSIKKMKVQEYIDTMGEMDDFDEETKASFEEVRQRLATMTREGEAGAAGYNAIFNDPKLAGLKTPGGKKISEMNMTEIQKFQDEMFAKSGHTPVGGYQFVKNTLFGGKNKKGEFVPGIVKPTEMNQVFSPEFQDELFKRMVNEKLEAFLNSDMSESKREEFKTYMKNTWEIFQGKTAYSQKFAKQLDEFLESPTIMQAHGGKNYDGSTKSKAERDAELNLEKKKFQKLVDEFTSPLGNTEIMTINGESATGKVGEVIQDKYEALRKRIKDGFGAIDPEEISNDLLNTLKIINEVNQAKGSDKQSSAGDVINNYNIDNSVVSSGGSGGFGSVYPVRYRNDHEHFTLAGVSRLT